MGKIFKFGCLGIIGIIVLMIVLAIIGYNGMNNTEETITREDAAPASTNETTKATDETEGLTQEKFGQIQEGMTYEEVADLIGHEGTLISETGEKGTDLHTVMYQWESADSVLANANFMFQGNKLMSKAQAGLGEGANSDVKITLEEFTEITNGMSYSEVQAIIGGEGELTSETGASDDPLRTITVTYYGEPLGSNVILVFMADRLESKSQFGLE
ncbi:DUF3862 domain-containing protein [Domibacillus robiginosus]|uniref:DUF3862 domain-containing protein n=1 Tax=Domibacillus robiginosus TaxID=1071054 RepID=UPI00067DEA40|nr:DUF3862 domain-containing protein [Domibacillus robiginosus]